MARDMWQELPEPPSWEDIFSGIPTAPGTEAQQARHKELREQGTEMTEAEEQEFNALFRAIYPQFNSPMKRLNQWFERQVEKGNGYILSSLIGYENPETRKYWQRCEEINQKRHQYPYNPTADQYDMSDEQANQLSDEWAEAGNAYEEVEQSKTAWKRYLGL